jgi:hypothetical protein
MKAMILNKNYYQLCVMLGLKQRDNQDNKTYILDNLEITDTYKQIIEDN